jgi:hypothetical protein
MKTPRGFIHTYVIVRRATTKKWSKNFFSFPTNWKELICSHHVNQATFVLFELHFWRLLSVGFIYCGLVVVGLRGE